MKKTAVDQLRDRLFKEFGFGYSDNIHDELKEIEKEQIEEYAKFCIHCDRNKLPLLDFEGFLNL